MDPEVLRELQDSIKSFNDQLSSFGSTMAGMANAVNQQSVATRDNTAEEKKNSESIKKGTGSVDPLAKANADAANIVKEANANFSKSARSSVESLTSFKNALLSAEKGLSKYGNAAESLGTAAYEAGKNFGALGRILGFALGAFGALTKDIFSLNDNIINFRDSFTETAGILPASTTEIGNLAKQARFSLDDMKKLSKTTNSLGQSLLGMGGYAGEGAIKFMQMAAVSDETRRRFGRMGISQEQLLDSQAKYVELQSVSGQSLNNQRKSVNTMQQESLAYAENLARVAALTGKKADQIQAGRTGALSEYEEQVKTLAENKRIAELRAKTNDPAAQEEAQRIEDEQKKRQEFLQHMADTGGQQQARDYGKMYRMGAYNIDTAGNAFIDGLEIMNEYKQSRGGAENLSRASQTIENRITGVLANEALQPAFQARGEELGQKLGGANNEYITALTLRGGPGAMAANRAKLAADMETKGEAGTDPFADTIESVRSIEREAKSVYQTFLESIDPLRGSMEALKFAAIAAAAVVGSIAIGSLASKIPGIGGMFNRGAGAVSGVAGGAAGGVAGGAARAAGAVSGADVGIQNLNRAASGGGGMVGGFLQGIVQGLAAAGRPPVPLYIVAGSVAIGAAITAIGAGLAGATWVMGKAMPSLANGLKAFDKLNGPNLRQVGFGMAGLGAGILAMGAGNVAGAIGNVINFLVGGDDPIKKVSSQVIELQGYDFDKEKVKNNSEAMVSFARAMAAASSISAIGSVAQASGAIAGGVASFFDKTPPLKKFVEFSELKIDDKQTKINAQAFVEFSTAMSSYEGYGDGIGALTATLGDAAAKFFGVRPPVDQFAYFSKLPIDEKKAATNSKSFVAFANAMSEYRGGPGLIETISALAGAGLSKIFGEDGPIEAFAKFAKMDFGPKAKDNSEAFFKYAQSANMLSSGAAAPSGGSSLGGAAAPGGGSSPGGAAAPSGGSSPGGAAAPGGGSSPGGAAAPSGGSSPGGAAAPAASVGGAGAIIPNSVLTFTSQSGSFANFQALNPEMKNAVLAAAADYKRETGRKMQVNSAQRAVADQERLWAQTIRLGTPGRGPGGMLVGRPPSAGGNPPHLSGKAIDLQEGKSDPSRAKPILARYGLDQRYGSRDPVHFELRASDGGIFDGPGASFPSDSNRGKKLGPINLDSLLMKLAKTGSDTLNPAASSSSTSSTDTYAAEDQGAMNLELYNMIQHKLDNVLNALDSSYSTQSKILRHSMV